ncbi:MAG: hypothetical protein ABGX10_06980 [Paracoccus sp. (in: a-proteobacteria)]
MIGDAPAFMVEALASGQVSTAFLPALIGAGASLIGGFLNRRSAQKQQDRAEDRSDAMTKEQRRWYLRDRQSDRKYDLRLTRNDRQYAEKMRDNERRYAANVLADQRSVDRQREIRQRMYDEKITASDRAYMAAQKKQQNKYDAAMYKRDITRYDTDRDRMQNRSNRLAEKSAATRGIDFIKLRDDAVKAGYNPMTALSMAHAYSTQVDYSLQGGVYSPRANYTTSNQGYSPLSQSSGGASSGGAAGAAPGAVMPSHSTPAGSFSAPGGGYQSQFNPALSSGSFIQEAIERGVDGWSNAKVEADPLADALRRATQQDQMASEVRNAEVPQGRGVGYSLTEQRPFQPSGKIGVPALSSTKAAPIAPKMPSGAFEVGGRKFVPVTKPDGAPGRLEASVARRLDIQPFDTVSPGDWAEIVGEIGEIETAANNPSIRRNITDEWHQGVSVGERVRDYFKSGRTGRPSLSSSSRMGEFPGAW